MKKFAIALMAMAASAAVMAESKPYATVTSVSGVVTVADKSQMLNAKPGMVLSQGASVLTGSTGIATVQFASGCAATVKPGQMLAVQEAECSASHARATAPMVIGGGSSAATGGEGLSGMSTGGMIAFGTVSVVALHEITKGKSKKLSGE
ncbi:hypothetical protein [Hydrogenophaga sp. NFH-34]|uniref:hypothetical protein n=1 Tax=Hydrogenophaga sp. NFH-34 TaxID=2744446 RepID=UPI001F165212|nr:hypothetical protein [Hydrogenophaga sp. NFH-34]